MGVANSQEYSALVRKRDPTWRQVGEQQGLAIYQQTGSPHKCMAFPLDQCDLDCHEKLQLLNFRQQNRTHLVTIDCILQAETDLFCGQPKNSLLLVEYIPLRLSGLPQQLTLSEGLTVASAALAGYAILSFVFGPLYASEEMICFDGKGKPKVWISYNLAAFQPSLYAVQGRHELSSSLMAELDDSGHLLTTIEKQKKCVNQLLEVIEKAMNNTFPADLKEEMKGIRTFRQGEQYISDYCRRNGLEINECVSRERRKKGYATYTAPHSDRLPLKYNAYRPSHLEYQQPIIHLGRDFQLIEPNKIEQIGHSQQVSAPRQSNTQRSGLRSSLNSHSRINIMYNITPQLHPPIYYQTLQPCRLPVTPAYHPQQPQPVSFHQFQHTHPIQDQPQIPFPPLLPKTSSQINNQLSIQTNNQNITAEKQKTISLQHIHHHVVNSIESQSDLPQFPTNVRQSQPDGNRFHLVVHEASDKEESQHVLNNGHLYQLDQEDRKSIDDIQMESAESKQLESEHPIEDENSPKSMDQLRQWEESLLKLADKQTKQDHEKQKKKEFQEKVSPSEERDKVNIEQIAIEPFKHEEDLERYIRNKYSEYFSNEGGDMNKPNEFRYDAVRDNEEGQKQTNQHTTSFKIPKGKTISFSEDIESNLERYPIINNVTHLLNMQQTSNQPKSSSVVNRSISSFPKYKTPVNLIIGIDEKYNKYVTNKQPIVRKDLSYTSNRSSEIGKEKRQNSRNPNYFQGSSQREKTNWKETPSRAGLSYDQLRRLLKE